MTAFTGHLILFVDVWTNFVQSDVEALSGYAFGGRSYLHARQSACSQRVGLIIRTSMTYGGLGRI